MVSALPGKAPSGHLPVLVDALGDPAFVIGLDGIVVAWNAAAEVLFGRKKKDAIGQRCPSLVMGRRPGGAFVCTPDCPYIQGFGLLNRETSTELMVRTAAVGLRRRVIRLHIPLCDAIGVPSWLLHVFVPMEDPALDLAAPA